MGRTLALLNGAIEALTEGIKTQTKWLRSRLGGVTTNDLNEMEKRMASNIRASTEALRAGQAEQRAAIQEIANDLDELIQKVADAVGNPDLDAAKAELNEAIAEGHDLTTSLKAIAAKYPLTPPVEEPPVEPVEPPV